MQRWATATLLSANWGLSLTLLSNSKLVAYVLDPWKIFCCPWIFSNVRESSCTVGKLLIIELLITLNIQKSRLNKVAWLNRITCRFVPSQHWACARVLHGVGWPVRVAGNRIYGAGVGTRTALRESAGPVRVELAVGWGGSWSYLVRVRGRHRLRNSFCG